MNRRALPIVVGAFVVGVLIDLPFDHPRFPGYGAAIGLFGTILLIVVAKKLLSPLVDRPEDHYPEDTVPDVQPDVWDAVVTADDRRHDPRDGRKAHRRDDRPATLHDDPDRGDARG
jgi:hypothetical protein